MIMLIAKRLAAAVVIILFLTAVMFTLQKVSPVDPVHAMLGAQASGSQILAERHRLGLDRPVVAQYLSYLGGLPRGDLGMSYRTRRPVSTDLGSFVPATAELTIYALLFALILAALLAIGSTLRWPGAGLLRLILIAGASVPAFLLAIAGILIFYQRLGWLPATGRTNYIDAPTGPTGFLTIDGLIAGRPAVTLDALAPPADAGPGGRGRPRRVDRPGAALQPDRRDAQRLRADGAGQGPVRTARSCSVTCSATASAPPCR